MACIRKRRGRWVIDFYDHHGKRRWKTLKEGITKKQAKEELRAIEDDVSKGSYLPAKKIPLFAKVAEDWLEYKKPKVRISTWEEYRRHVNIHFEELKTLKITKINTAAVEKFIGERQAQGMNINTLRRILVVLNQIMNYAVRHRYIEHNPVREAERPRNTGNWGHSKGKVTIFDPEQINALLKGVVTRIEEKAPKIEDPARRSELLHKAQKYRMLFMLAVFSGARQGELLGLKWSDIDWEKSQVHIQRTFNHGRFFPPKSETSNRRIDLGPAVLRELKKWKLACPKTKLNLVFPSAEGTPMDNHDMISRHFRPTLKEAKLPMIRFHDLRHTYASLLIDQGENVKYIQNQLGHSSPTVTLDVYAHLMKKRNPEAALRLEKTIFETNGSKTVAN